MNVPLRRVASVVLVMFLALMVSTTYIQFFQADELNGDPRNVRTIYSEYGNYRGPIVVAGEAIASSTPVDDPFGFQRAYANGPLYAPVSGYFSVVNGTSEIERSENEFLNGEASSLWLDRLTALFTGEQPQGASVELTIDPAAQQAAWDALGDQRGAVAAIEPSTGRVLALVSKPSYDPNALATHDTGAANAAFQELANADGDPMSNRAIRGNTYPPGSTFKLVTSAAAIESGEYTAESVIPAPDVYQYPQSTSTMSNFGGIRCSPTGEMTLADALRISCNTAFADLGVTLGDDELRDQAEDFGFDDDGLTIPMDVTASRFPTDEQADPAATARAAIGQGDVRATPLQMAMVASAIANDGVLMTPYTVETVRDPDLEVVQQSEPRRLRTSVSPSTAAQLTEMMIGVVNNGSGTAAQIPGVQVAGKTGTAENDPEKAPHAWFTSFAPADDPQVAVAVIVENGGSSGSEATGGAVAAPIARAVIEAVLAG
ncbi:peptidoglycan D,D-transpeptidase FtsI family protein [Cellulosimicrobium marinum]|uniref:peptidoglycan D,D-transpeptidase FtsI family protein n=1 Tax=Cellulosimicrobium marinum TaxID=1638992 RepID=UPI001E528BBC|nr:penicillin-binding transpeptidase domain-containing protein [Cellulosimicrobium marinum]MCB7135746.1 penicillin-binding protein 2 [Cellulosimicrobium marinum]